MHRLLSSAGRTLATILACAGLTAASAAVGSSAAAAALPPNCTGKKTVTCTFEYNGTDGTDGDVQTFTVPEKVDVLTIDAWGAQGGGGLGGLGGHNASTIKVSPGDVLEIRVGGRPSELNGRGFNGGGRGGGGASDVRPAGGDLSARIVTAGGGGGSGGVQGPDTPMTWREGGAGGGGDGSDACSANTCGRGGTQAAGGAAGSGGNLACGQAGSFGNGGSGDCWSGGGGGWYGGGSGDGFLVTSNGFPIGAILDGGGGGSGHVAYGVKQVHESGVREGHGLVTITYSKSPVPPMGAISCPLTGGTITFSKPLTLSPNSKLVRMRIKATGTGCDSSGVVGGKAPITDVEITGTVPLGPGAACIDRELAQGKPAKFQVKWRGRNAKNKPITVGTSSTSVSAMDFSLITQLGLGLNAVTNEKKPFANQRLYLWIEVAEDLVTQGIACAFDKGLKTLHIVGGTATALQ